MYNLPRRCRWDCSISPVIIPNTQQYAVVMLSPGAVLGFFIGIGVSVKRRLGSMGRFTSTINIIVLDNPMTFHFSQFLDSASWGNRRLYAGVYRHPAGAINLDRTGRVPL